MSGRRLVPVITPHDSDDLGRIDDEVGKLAHDVETPDTTATKITDFSAPYGLEIETVTHFLPKSDHQDLRRSRLGIGSGAGCCPGRPRPACGRGTRDMLFA